MINAVFFKRNDVINGFEVSGHAGFDDYGRDIVCAGVTSAVMMTFNAICEILMIKAITDVSENKISLLLPDTKNNSANAFIEALHLHLQLLSEENINTIKITDAEV